MSLPLVMIPFDRKEMPLVFAALYKSIEQLSSPDEAQRNPG
jgi:hypothetical protein